MPTILTAKPGFTFGADPELFVVDQNGNGVFPEFIPGDKKNPVPVKGGAIQRDGMAAEFNIDPSSSYEEFNQNIVSVLKEMKSLLPKGYKLVSTPSMTFSEDVWDKAPEEAKTLGCSPDFNALTGGVNTPPNDPENPRMRCLGGHLHIGWTKGKTMDDLDHIGHGRDLVKQLDWYLAAWSLQQDTDKNRRRLYGKAGSCRFKDYGVEYRTLSSFWVLNANSRLQVWNRMQRAIEAMRTDYMPDTASKYNDMLVEAINTATDNPSLNNRFYYPIMAY